MCGIAGILLLTPRSLLDAEARTRALLRPHSESLPEHWLDSLETAIAHRGPDGRGRFRDRSIAPDGSIVDIALVHRRLSIIDHACGAQPMVTLHTRREHPAPRPASDLLPPGIELPPAAAFLAQSSPTAEPRYRPCPASDRALRATVFNGCMYNHAAIRAELQSLGAEFTTDHSDTEVIPHALQEWGDGAPNRLDAMFALAAWDHDAASLLISRDRFGEKPLYITEGPTPDGRTRIVFASTAAAVAPFVTAQRNSDTADAQQVVKDTRHALSMRSWVQFGFGAASPDEGLDAQLPGTSVIRQGLAHTRVDHRGLSQATLHSFGDDEVLTDEIHSPARTARLDPARTLELLETAVRSRLVADVPIACFLSGGVDSSLIAALASRHVGTLQTVTVKMPDASINESAHARAVATYLGTQHTEIDAGSDLIGDPTTDLSVLIAQSGLPLADSSILASLWVSRAASRVAKVALGGDAGDELFAGYDRYRAASMFAAAGPFRYAGLVAGSWPPENSGPRARRWRALNAAAHDGYADLLSIFPRTMLDQLWPVSRAFRRDESSIFDLAPVQPDRPALLPSPFNDATERAISTDVRSYLPNDLLRKVDTASMSVPLEVRSPMLARALSDAALRAPIRSLSLNRERKGLLRAVARTLLPASVIDRPKQGFASPIASWLRTDVRRFRTLARDRLLSPDAFSGTPAHASIREPVVRRLLDEHTAGTHDHAQRIYCLLVMSLWASWRQTVRPIGD